MKSHLLHSGSRKIIWWECRYFIEICKNVLYSDKNGMCIDNMPNCEVLLPLLKAYGIDIIPWKCIIYRYLPFSQSLIFCTFNKSFPGWGFKVHRFKMLYIFKSTLFPGNLTQKNVYDRTFTIQNQGHHLFSSKFVLYWYL